MKPISDFFFFFLILTTIGCVKTKTQSMPQSTAVVWATSILPIKQDWTECKNKSCTLHANLVMEGLVRPDREETLALAETITFLSPLEIRIRLKRGIRWNDGTDLKAKDFETAWKNTWKKCRKIPEAKYFSPILGAEAGCRKTPLSGVESLSDYDLRISLSAPSPFFLRRLAHPLFFPKRLDAPDSTLGRFMFLEKGKYAPNPQHFLFKRTSRRGIHFIEVAKESERIHLFLEGSADVADELTPRSIFPIKSHPNLQAYLTGQKVFMLLDSVPAAKHRQALVESLLLSEPVELVDFGLEQNRSLLNEINAAQLRQGVDFPKALKEKLAETEVAINIPSDALLADLARNFQAQWQTRLSIEVPATRGDSEKGIRFKQWRPNWLEPELPPFVSSTGRPFSNRENALAAWNKAQKEWVETEFLLSPLFETQNYLLRKANVGPIERSLTGGWAFDRFTP